MLGRRNSECPQLLHSIAVRRAEKLDYREISSAKVDYYSIFVY